MTISIRQLQPTDRGDWERLFRAYVDFYERSLEPEAYDRAWARLLADAEIHGRAACLDGRVVGIAHFLTHAHTNADDVCYLQDLFTAPAARGRGVARALIEHVTEWARVRRCSRLYWQTQASNARARSLYDQVAEHRGFIVYQIGL